MFFFKLKATFTCNTKKVLIKNTASNHYNFSKTKKVQTEQNNKTSAQNRPISYRACARSITPIIFLLSFIFHTRAHTDWLKLVRRHVNSMKTFLHIRFIWALIQTKDKSFKPVGNQFF